ncbi:hypothetical protein PIB30_028540 [Stylosanthes scabra]|uniref:Uncharacterized protein n=1 Tax=Stylosanthes scabra TaxID=79078 RepID=A0ABU6SBL2_9FABA|nr:hypothetical protein [Stylosanthes scabra]
MNPGVKTSFDCTGRFDDLLAVVEVNQTVMSGGFWFDRPVFRTMQTTNARFGNVVALKKLLSVKHDRLARHTMFHVVSQATLVHKNSELLLYRRDALALQSPTGSSIVVVA